MNLVITCGPAYAPLDQVRRLTNFSTGSLGVTLAEAFQKAGHSVFCLRGSGATFRNEPAGIRFQDFETNADLEAQLETLSRTERIDAVFHAAALCDFSIAEVRDESGQIVSSAKFSSRSEGGYTLRLQPLPKLLPRFRALFPKAKLVGWKYEMGGGRERVITLGQRQLKEAGTDLCVLNGPGYSPGVESPRFGLLTTKGIYAEASDVHELATALGRWLELG